ncbi:MAG: hypothetical protein HS111_28640 [Kofleriaceae bacterium]|nr:hypothetical protein [Kofleriaceae bacterium]
MTAVIVIIALVLVVLAIGSMALEPTRDDAADRTPRRHPARSAGTAGDQPSPLVEALGHAIEAATDDQSSRDISGGAPRARTAGAERDDRDRATAPCGRDGLGTYRPRRARRRHAAGLELERRQRRLELGGFDDLGGIATTAATGAPDRNPRPVSGQGGCTRGRFSRAARAWRW